MVYSVEKTLREHRDKLAEPDAERVETALMATREAAKGDDVGRMKATIDQLKTASHAAAEALYQAAGGDSEEAKAPAGASEPDVVDAEFAEVEDR